MNQLVIKFLSLAIFTIISHKNYVSTTLIDFDLKTKSFEITLKVFYDDLEPVSYTHLTLPTTPYV